MAKKKSVFSGADGFKALTEHMKVLQYERKNHGQTPEYSTDYFKGILHGLNLVDAIGGDINTQLFDFVLRDRGFDQLPEAVRNARPGSPYLSA